MNNFTETFEKDQIQKLTGKKRIPAFRSGDTMKVTIKIIEGERSRLQIFEGVCIARKNNSLNSNFTVRKISHGEGVERIFPLFSPLIEKIEVVRKGDVKRAKLYYLRDRKGKSARIVDSNRGQEADQYSILEDSKPTTLENNKTLETPSETKTNKIVQDENEIKEKNEEKKEPSNKTVEKTEIEEKSDSSVNMADKIKNESKT